MDEKAFYELHHKRIKFPEHSDASLKTGLISECRLEVGNKIGRRLKSTEIVHHHYNKDGSVTLVLCPDKQYHKLLHIREEALRYCGNANWRKCVYCKQYDDPKNLIINTQVQHKSCIQKYRKEYRNGRNKIFSSF